METAGANTANEIAVLPGHSDLKTQLVQSTPSTAIAAHANPVSTTRDHVGRS